MKIPYVLLDFSGEVKDLTNWDMTLIKDVLDGNVWQPAQGYEFEKLNTKKFVAKFGVVVIPARQNAEKLKEVQEYISKMEWCVIMLIGDEERSFDYKKLKHPKMKVWLMQPLPEDEADYYLGSGYTPHIRQLKDYEQSYLDKPLDWFFAGQINHPRREAAAKILERMLDRDDMQAEFEPTKGFTQGMPPKLYISKLAKAKAVPCPSGIQVPDSFRLFEALEAGAVPIADDISHVLIHEPGYWGKVFNGHGTPFKVYDDVDNLEGYIADVQREYPAINNRVYAWWQNVKRDMAYKLCEHIHELSGQAYTDVTVRSKITVIIPTSPIPSHPDTKIIDQTIRDMRAKLLDCEIIIGIDGVREEQEDRRADYEEYQKRLLWKCNFEWTNVIPVRFEEHLHQAEMTRRLLQMVNTPLIMFVEHDTALTPDYQFEWPQLIRAVESGEANMIRFNHEALILPEYEHLMLGDREDVCGIPMIKTVQWSQRPHLASTAFYKNMIARYFTEESRTMIEDVVHGKLMSAYEDDGMMGWYDWRVWVYAPRMDNIKRSYTTDGRGDDPKFEDKYVF